MAVYLSLTSLIHEVVGVQVQGGETNQHNGNRITVFRCVRRRVSADVCCPRTVVLEIRQCTLFSSRGSVHCGAVELM